MAVNVSVQFNGGFLPDIMLLTQCCYHHRGNAITYEFFVSYAGSHLNILTFFSLITTVYWGMLLTEGLDAFRFFTRTTKKGKNNKL